MPHAHGDTFASASSPQAFQNEPTGGDASRNNSGTIPAGTDDRFDEDISWVIGRIVAGSRRFSNLEGRPEALVEDHVRIPDDRLFEFKVQPIDPSSASEPIKVEGDMAKEAWNRRLDLTFTDGDRVLVQYKGSYSEMDSVWRVRYGEELEEEDEDEDEEDTEEDPGLWL
ncbi:MAG: hypothetical protein ASARMPRED_000477 [Alectoria sarmentosa]|nr:MAG: hypothetical protein ASARMPRED_000477 [Alectoria sarmentosa]